jgi:hypothetical protein
MWAAMNSLAQAQGKILSACSTFSQSVPCSAAAPCTKCGQRGSCTPCRSSSRARHARPCEPRRPRVSSACCCSPPAITGFHTRGPWVVGTLYHVVLSAPLMPIAEDDISECLWYCISRGLYVGITLSNPLALAAVVGVVKCKICFTRGLSYVTLIGRFSQERYSTLRGGF